MSKAARMRCNPKCLLYDEGRKNKFVRIKNTVTAADLRIRFLYYKIKI